MLDDGKGGYSPVRPCLSPLSGHQHPHLHQPGLQPRPGTPFLVYDAGTAALTVGPPPPDGYLRDAMDVGRKLYALLATFVRDDDGSYRYPTMWMQVLAWEPKTD